MEADALSRKFSKVMEEQRQKRMAKREQQAEKSKIELQLKSQKTMSRREKFKQSKALTAHEAQLVTALKKSPALSFFDNLAQEVGLPEPI